MLAEHRQGRPRCFVSHGTHDPVLPIDQCSRRIVRELRDERYDVRYTEFDGGHEVPPEVTRAAVDWPWPGGERSHWLANVQSILNELG